MPDEEAKQCLRARLPAMRPIDYALLIGMPILFFLVAMFGLMRIIGPIPKSSPVQRIKDGEIKAGMSAKEIVDKLGAPKEIQAKPDGSATIIYTRTVADGDLQIEEGVITLDTAGRVVESHVDRQLPTKSGSGL